LSFMCLAEQHKSRQ